MLDIDWPSMYCRLRRVLLLVKRKLVRKPAHFHNENNSTFPTYSGGAAMQVFATLNTNLTYSSVSSFHIWTGYLPYKPLKCALVHCNRATPHQVRPFYGLHWQVNGILCWEMEQWTPPLPPFRCPSSLFPMLPTSVLIYCLFTALIGPVFVLPVARPIHQHFGREVR